MAGKVGDKVTDENHAIYLENLKEAAKLLKENNIIGLIEPINHYSVPGYYLDSYQRGKLNNRVFLLFNIFLIRIVHKLLN